MTTQPKPAKSFLIIGIVALVWNITGIMAFTMNILMTTEAISALPDAERAYYESTPAWLNFIYGIAVFAGTLGSILLLMKKALGYRVFIVSLIAILVQMSYSLLMTTSIEVYGPTALIMPMLVTGIAIFLVWYSRSAIAKGLVS